MVYDATGVGGLPGNLLGVGSQTSVAGNGEAASTFTGVPVVSGTSYWVGFTVSTITNNVYAPGQTLGMAFNADTYASPTNPFGASPSTANFRIPLILTVAPPASTARHKLIMAESEADMRRGRIGIAEASNENEERALWEALRKYA